MGGLFMSTEGRIQLNVRISKATSDQLDEIVEYYQQNTRLGRVYKGDVLTDIIQKSHEIMEKQKAISNRKY
jgi:hypothetical protein